MGTHKRGFRKGHVNPLCIPGCLQRSLRLIPEPSGTGSACGAEFHLARSHERGESQAGKHERRLHQRSFFWVVQTPHKVRNIDKGKPVAGGRKSRKESGKSGQHSYKTHRVDKSEAMSLMLEGKRVERRSKGARATHDWSRVVE